VGDASVAHRRRSNDYCFAQLFEDICHVPPAFSQSVCVVYCEKSPDVEPELGDGLADGEAPDPLGDDEVLPEAPEVAPLPPLEPVAPDVPDGPPAPELLPAAPLPLPEPADWATTSAGASNMMETSRRARKCFM